jgi:hypothetical protein
MKIFSLFLALVTTRTTLSYVFAKQADCNADNCLRGVREIDADHKPAPTSRLSDCSSFMEITVTPAPTQVLVHFIISIESGSDLEGMTDMHLPRFNALEDFDVITHSINAIVKDKKEILLSLPTCQEQLA